MGLQNTNMQFTSKSRRPFDLKWPLRALGLIALFGITYPTWANEFARYNIKSWTNEDWSGYQHNPYQTYQFFRSEVNDHVTPTLPPWQGGDYNYLWMIGPFPSLTDVTRFPIEMTPAMWDTWAYFNPEQTNLVPQASWTDDFSPLYAATDWSVRLESRTETRASPHRLGNVKTIGQHEVINEHQVSVADSYTAQQAHGEALTWAGYDASAASTWTNYAYNAETGRHDIRLRSTADSYGHNTTSAEGASSVIAKREFTLNRAAKFDLSVELAALQEAGFSFALRSKRYGKLELASDSFGRHALSGQSDQVDIEGIIKPGQYTLEVEAEARTSLIESAMAEFGFNFELNELPGTVLPQYVLRPATYKLRGDEVIYEVYPGDELPFDLRVNKLTGQVVDFVFSSPEDGNDGPANLGSTNDIGDSYDPGGTDTSGPVGGDTDLFESGLFLSDSSAIDVIVADINEIWEISDFGYGQSDSINPDEIEFWTNPYWELVSGEVMTFGDLASSYQYGQGDIWDLRPNAYAVNIPTPSSIFILGLLSLSRLTSNPRRRKSSEV